MKILIIIRSTIFLFAQLLITPVFALIAFTTFGFSALVRYRVISIWSHLSIAMARFICGVRYQIRGKENLPSAPCIVLSKHQSAWETLAYQEIFPPQVWVLKKELLRIPFFGWGLAMLSPIAIDRCSGTSALNQILEQGKDRLDRGFWVVVFPEGTRIPPGSSGKYQIGGAWLAAGTGIPVIPVAHNAGELWVKNIFFKHPGLITVSIGAPIDPTGLSAQEINQRVQSWIENEMQTLPAAIGA